jgi:hypothetical protein
MGSKVNKNEEEQSCEIRAIDLQKSQQQQDNPCLREMTPSISNPRCGSNCSLGPSCIRENIGDQGQDSQSSPLMIAVEHTLSSLTSTAANNNAKQLHDRNENERVLLDHQEGLNSFTTGDLEVINEFRFEEYALPEVARDESNEGDTAYEYDETFAPMIVDTVDDVGIESCPAKFGSGNASSSALLSAPCSPTNEHSSLKVFCPSRTPRRSSMKGSEEALSSSPRRASIGASGESFEIVLPGHSEPIERRRSITFDDRIDIENIVPIRLLATGGPQSLWYQEQEYEAIKFKTLALLDRVDHSSGITDGKKYCMRGLEKFMSPEATEVKRHQAWDAVLNEQFLQRKDGEFDDEDIANIYMHSTKRSKREASKRASLDAEASEAYLLTTFRRHSSNDLSKEKTDFNRRVSI